MSFRNYHQMYRVKGARVVEGEHILSLQNFLDRSASTQNFVAVKVIHRTYQGSRKHPKRFEFGAGHINLESVWEWSLYIRGQPSTIRHS